MKLILKLVLILIATVGIGLLLIQDTGYVYISVWVYEVEIALTFFIILLSVVYYTIFKSIDLVSGIMALSGNLQEWHAQRKARQALNAYHRGMLQMSQGNWRGAERDFVRYIGYSSMPMVSYLCAARAAQSAGAVDRRDRYLQLAYEVGEKDEAAVTITQAELQIEQEQFGQALTALKQIQEKDLKNNYALELMVKIYQQMDDWKSIHELIPVLRKRQVFSAEQFEQLERRAFQVALESFDIKAGLAELKKLWNSAPKSLRDDKQLIKIYCAKVIQLNEPNEVEPVLRNYLKKDCDDDMVELYGQLDIEPIVKQITLVESLAQQDPSNPVILLTLGRLCLKNKLWGRARNYFESSIGAGTSSEAYKELADLLTQLGEKDSALEYYRAGMSLAMKRAS